MEFGETIVCLRAMTDQLLSKCSLCILAAVLLNACISVDRPSIKQNERPTFSWNDMEQDGFPDGLQMQGEDAGNFLKWFCLIAEYQFYKMSPRWNPEQRDCSGLIRFAMREALRKHTRQWLYNFGGDGRLAASAPEDPSLDLDSLPIGEKIFRTRSGAFHRSDIIDGTFAEFADARTLRSHNCRFVTRDPKAAKPGDLVFYYDPTATDLPYHVMLFLGQPEWEEDGHIDWVVYHTGATAKTPGVVKKVRLSELSQHPDRRWHPSRNNPCFLGFYRLKIVDRG